MSHAIIPFEKGEEKLDWIALTKALRQGHKFPKAEIADSLLYRGKDTLLSRSAWIDGMGVLTKSATVFPKNPAHGQPMIGGGVMLFDDKNGALSATVDFHLITKWKTAGDSLLAALHLANPDARDILIVGAGTVGENLIAAFSAGFAQARFTVWNRTQSKAEDLCAKTGAHLAEDLEAAVRRADIILSATMTSDPIIKGEWLRAGQHVNLIGAYRPDMREVDDLALQKSRIYVDSYGTTLDHIGELKIRLQTGAIARDDVLADFYGLDGFAHADDEITLFKNGGGAHLDLMVAQYILQCWCG